MEIIDLAHIVSLVISLERWRFVVKTNQFKLYNLFRNLTNDGY